MASRLLRVVELSPSSSVPSPVRRVATGHNRDRWTQLFSRFLAAATTHRYAWSSNLFPAHVSSLSGMAIRSFAAGCSERQPPILFRLRRRLTSRGGENMQRKLPKPSREQAEDAVRTPIRWAGDDPRREDMRGTLARGSSIRRMVRWPRSRPAGISETNV